MRALPGLGQVVDLGAISNREYLRQELDEEKRTTRRASGHRNAPREVERSIVSRSGRVLEWPREFNMNERAKILLSESGGSVTSANRVEPFGHSTIKDLVQRFKVCWEVHPEDAVIYTGNQANKNEELREIGFSFELYGTYEAETDDVSPGSIQFEKIVSALAEIAHCILPRERTACSFEVEIDSQDVRYSGVRGDRPDVRVVIHILHRHSWDNPIDPFEECCVQDMEKTLQTLGASKGAWSPPSGAF